MPVNRGTQEDSGAHVTLHALERSTTITQLVPADQSSEPQIVFPWASISPSAVARYTVSITHGQVKAMAGSRPNPTKPCKATMVSVKLLAYFYPRQLAIGLGSTLMLDAKIIHEDLEINSSTKESIRRQQFAVNNSPSTDAQRSSRGCSSFPTPLHGSLAIPILQILFSIVTVLFRYQPCQSHARIMDLTSMSTLVWPSRRDPACASTNCCSELSGNLQITSNAR